MCSFESHSFALKSSRSSKLAEITAKYSFVEKPFTLLQRSKIEGLVSEMFVERVVLSEHKLSVLYCIAASLAMYVCCDKDC